MPKVYSIDGIVPVAHPAALEPGRKRIDITGAIPLSELKARTK